MLTGSVSGSSIESGLMMERVEVRDSDLTVSGISSVPAGLTMHRILVPGTSSDISG